MWKCYIADTLTLIRFALVFVLIYLAITDGSIAAAFSVFVIGEITDALDGTCSEKWPFPKKHEPKWRKYASIYDMVADILLALAMGLFFIWRVNTIFGLIILAIVGGLAIILDFVCYGRLLGHPDTAKPGSLALKNFKVAKKLILVRRVIYVSLIVVAAIYTLFKCEWPLAAKITLLIIGLLFCAFLVKFLQQRLHNISRDAVGIEKKLEEKK